MSKNQCKDTYQSPIQNSQKTAVDAPLLKVSPACRVNRTRARFPSRSGRNLQEGGRVEKPTHRHLLTAVGLALSPSSGKRVNESLTPARGMVNNHDAAAENGDS